MENPIKKIKTWMHWRGISPSDLVYALGSLGFLITTIVLLLTLSC
jgi:hypothetical protein